MADLFSSAEPAAPLAEILRPHTLDDVIGQSHLIGPGKPLRLAFESGKPHSMIFWGPAGVGKTTLARLTASAFDCAFITLSAVFLTYTLSSIGGVFFMTAGTFGIMSVYGYVTKADLSKMGNMCLMGLFGIILATVLGFFFDSTLLQMLISYAGILIFTGLTIYDTQSIKRLALTYHSRATDEGQKVAIMGALTLYLDFINIFIYLLRLFGDRK